MPLKNPIHPGTVVWTGENPGILLKEDPDGPFSSIALFFRIFYSPVGRGTVLLLLQKPNEAVTMPTAANVIITDNKVLGEYLMETFIGKLPAFAALPGCQSAQIEMMTEGYAEGDPRSCYKEIVRTSDLDVELIWDGLGKPVALELPPELTGGKENELYSLLVESTRPQIVVNGEQLPGKPVERIQAGIKTTTAFLYFSETWIQPA
ncbi:MAG: hypothetical protein ACI8P9_005799 [Parasphingorhabdus sp.]|jgi:hypothetical protein